MANDSKMGLVLTGGGARGAYQAGVLKGLAAILPETKTKTFPFPILTGVSAGAINTAFLATQADDFKRVTDQLAALWSKLTIDQVFRTDFSSLGSISLKVITDLTFGALYKRKMIKSLLDTSPLRLTLNKYCDYAQIQSQIDRGHIESVAITATEYTSSFNITFVQTNDQKIHWERHSRRSELAQIGVDHVMASAAIPLFFPAIGIGNRGIGEHGTHERYFGDGCLRNMAPLSGAIHLGAKKLFVAGVRRLPQMTDPLPEKTFSPSVARILGVIINAIFFDATDLDIERLSRINETLKSVSLLKRGQVTLKPIDFFWINPTADISDLALQKAQHLPKALRYLLGGLGSLEESSAILSYLLFHPKFCGALIDLGYQDCLKRKDEIVEFFET